MVVLIPSYEPNYKLIKVISEIRENTDYKILVVDDGSGEKYQGLYVKAEELGCTVLHHGSNLGKGQALKTGFRFLLTNEWNESVVCADSDGQHHVTDIIRVADAVDESNREMVLGVRKFEGEIPVKSRIGNSVTAFLFEAITNTHITDTQTGLRGYPGFLIHWLCEIEGNRFEYELNLLLKAREEGIAIRQIPILTIYENQNKATHFHPIKDSIRVYIPLFKFSLSSFLSALLDFTLLFLFQTVTGSLLLGVILARLISSVFNYSVNKFMVFKARNIKNTQSVPKYFSLVLVIMLINYGILAFLAKTLFIPTVIAKILTECILFVFSYTIQKKFVFRGNKKIQKNCFTRSFYRI